MMDLSRFTEEPPTLPQPEVPEREDETKLPPCEIPAAPPGCALTARYLPTIELWIAGENRTTPYCWGVDAAGKIATPEHPAVRRVEGRMPVWHLLGWGKRSQDALDMARERKEAGV